LIAKLVPRQSLGRGIVPPLTAGTIGNRPGCPPFAYFLGEGAVFQTPLCGR
jgi:hypothetical protein